MEKTPRTSFIPKQNTGSATGGVRRRRRLNLFSFFAVVVFLGTLTLSIGIFFYKQYSENQLSVNKQQLANSRSSFQQGDIESITELDRRLRTAESLLDSHVAVSKIFDALEERTQSAVQLDGLKYERFESGNIQILTTGSAPRFNTVALQELQFGDEALFDTVTFSDINVVLGEDGEDDRIVFGMSALLNGNLVLYEVFGAEVEEVIIEGGQGGEDGSDVNNLIDGTEAGVVEEGGQENEEEKIEDPNNQ